MATRLSTVSPTCPQCGSDVAHPKRQGRPRIYCGIACSGRHRIEAESLKSQARWSRSCAHCAKQMRPGQNKTLCSNACKVAAYKDRHPDRVKTDRARSASKRLAMLSSGYHQDCLMYRRWARQARPKRERVRQAKACRDCGSPVLKGQQRCQPCRSAAIVLVRAKSKRSEATKRGRREAKARRRAIERGVFAERFDPFEIFGRDKWHCHLCGISTPKRLRGTYDDRAPELDHVVPLAAGGLHTRINTACACRKCNGDKGAKPLGQMRLAA